MKKKVSLAVFNEVIENKFVCDSCFLFYATIKYSKAADSWAIEICRRRDSGGWTVLMRDFCDSLDGCIVNLEHNLKYLYLGDFKVVIEHEINRLLEDAIFDQ